MNSSPASFHKSILYLNRYAASLKYEPASFHVHYWGSKPDHHGNTFHTHPFHELCYVAAGEGTYIREDVTYPLKTGTLYCSAPGTRHRIQSDSGMLLWFVAFETVEGETAEAVKTMMERWTRAPHLFIPNAADSSPVLLWRSLLQQTSRPDVPFPEGIVRLAHTLLLTAVEQLAEHAGAGAPGLPQLDGAPAPQSGLLKQAGDYIRARLADKLHLGDVAAALHISERQLSRLIAAELGITFPTWIRTERTKRAGYLLAFTDMLLEDIAQEAGFESVHYFNRVFKEVLNVSPGKFRKMTQGREADTALIHQYLHRVVTKQGE